MILASSPFRIMAISYLFSSRLMIAVSLQISDSRLCQRPIGCRTGRPPDAHTHLGQHGALTGFEVEAHGAIFTDCGPGHGMPMLSQA